MLNANIKKYAADAADALCPSIGPKGLSYKITKVAYYIAAVIFTMSSLALAFSCLINMTKYSVLDTTSKTEYYNEQRMYLITMIIILLLILCGYILQRFKLGLPLLCTGAVNCVLSFITFYSASVDNSIKNGGMQQFWLLLGGPSIFAAIMCAALGIMIFLYKMTLKKEYTKITERLYYIHSENGSKNLVADEFNKIMNDYDGKEAFRTDIPLKKSVKRRKEKQESENE